MDGKIMNKLYFSLIAGTLLTLSSCESKINNFMVDDTVSLVNPGLVEETVYIGLEDNSNVYVLKSGKGFQAAKVHIEVDNTIINEYNETAKIPVSELSTECYSIAVGSLELSKSDYISPFEISWNREKLAEALENDPDLVIPLRLYVENEDVNVNLERVTTLIKPNIDTPLISLDKYGYVKGLTPTRRTSLEEDVYISVSSNFIPKDDIDFTLTVDADALDKYNQENGTAYKILPEEAYRLEKNWTIKKAMTTSRFKFTFVREALIPEDGPSKFGTFILPITMSEVSSSAVNPKQATIFYAVSVVASPIDKSTWSIVECNSEIANDPNPATATDQYPSTNLIDGNSATYWKSLWSVDEPFPYYVIIDLGVDRDLYKIGYEIPSGLNRLQANNKAGYVEASLDGTNWENIANWIAPSKTTSAVEFEVNPTTARYIKFVITESFSSPHRTAIAEINAWGE